jgi:hypothetical protein
MLRNKPCKYFCIYCNTHFHLHNDPPYFFEKKKNINKNLP